MEEVNCNKFLNNTQELPFSLNASCTCGMTEEEAEVEQLIKVVLQGYVQIGINFIGLIMNSISINCLLTKELRASSFNKTLILLAAFDITFNGCDILESIRRIHYDRHSCLPMPFYQIVNLYLWPHVLYPLRTFMIISSIYTTVVIALERYFAVSKPICTFIQNNRQSWRQVLLAVTPAVSISLFLSFPTIFEFIPELKNFQCENGEQVKEIKTIEELDELKQCFENDSTISVSQVLVPQWTGFVIDDRYILYKNIVFNILTFLIPLLMLFVLNLLIYIQLKRRRKIIEELGKYRMSI